MSQWILFLSIAATVLLLSEIFIPGGILGAIGFLLLLIATFMAAQRYSTAVAAVLFFGISSLCILAFILFFRSPLSSMVVLKSTSPKDDLINLQDLVGKQGQTTSPLRPVGKAAFVIGAEERLLDVLADGELIEAHQKVEITKIDGSRIIVKKLV